MYPCVDEAAVKTPGLKFAIATVTALPLPAGVVTMTEALVWPARAHGT